MKKRTFPVTQVGITSLIMVFILLCMIIFAILSLSGALNEDNFSQRIAKNNTAYLDASNQANQFLARLDQQLAASSLQDPQALFKDPSALTSDLNVQDLVLTKDLQLSFRIPVTETQSLEICIQIAAPDGSENFNYQVLSWKKQTSATWHSDNSINLLQ